MRAGIGGRPPTLETVAAEAGVSRATVSRVVNLATTVSPAVRASVEAAIARLGYVPNRAARALVTRRTGSVAVVMREPVDFGVADPYLASLVVAAGQSLIGSGTHMVVLMAPADDEDPWFSNFLRSASPMACCCCPPTTATRCPTSWSGRVSRWWWPGGFPAGWRA